MLLHIISKDDLAAARSVGQIAPESLEVEGFVHCSYPEQVLTPANERFHGRSDLVLLALDAAQIQPRLVVEDCYRSGTSFPHVYGPIPVHAIDQEIEFLCGVDGGFTLPPLALAEVCSVRESSAEELAIRIDYFHDATEGELVVMGVDPALLPERDQWLRDARDDLARPVEERDSLSLVWLKGGHIVGFSTADQITVGRRAHMHLHMINRSGRNKGLGVRLLRLSASHYFNALSLQRLYCEPNALNVAPNRTLQAAGFLYEYSHYTIPGPINTYQMTTRWVLKK